MIIPNWVGLWGAVGCLAIPLLVWIGQELRQAWARRQAARRVHILGSAAAHPLHDVAPRPQRGAADWDWLVNGQGEGEDKA